MPDPAILLYARPGATADRVRDVLADAHLRVVRAHEPADAHARLLDEPVGLLLFHGPALSSFSERLFRQWRDQDPLLEAVGLAGGTDGTEPALVRMDCRAIVPGDARDGELASAVQHALERRRARAALVRGDETMASLVLQATHALVAAVELKDAYTRGRSNRVALFAGILADEIGGLDLDTVRLAARLMDVGKTSIPESILNKTDRLTEEEFELVKRHPMVSWETLRHLFDDALVLEVARHHHERWDGRGYPDRLQGEEIPMAVRIVTVADSLDAITSTRAFRQARLWSEAVDEIVRGSGTRYDPAVVETLQDARDRLLVGA